MDCLMLAMAIDLEESRFAHPRGFPTSLYIKLLVAIE